MLKTLTAEDKERRHFLELSLATLDDKEAEKDEKMMVYLNERANK